MGRTKPVMWCAALGIFSAGTLFAQGTILYKTGFEAAEGYDPQYTLAGQRGWSSDGSGGNGLIAQIPGMGQQAYLGIYPPADTNSTTTVWYPVNFVPPATAKIVKFTTTMQIYKSVTGGDDEFRWAVYNADGNRLFSIDFFTDTDQIYYELQDRALVDTGWTFTPADGPDNGIYDLEIWMDFGRNSWKAALNGAVIASGEKIALEQSTALTLGDVDGVWAVTDPSKPGDNLMLFDDYTLSSENSATLPSSLDPNGFNANGNFEFVLQTEPGVHYAVDRTIDFQQWFQLTDFTATEGTSVFEDTTSKNSSLSFYRLREL